MADLNDKYQDPGGEGFIPIEALGGKAWAEFPDDGGTIFAFSLPSRREEDAAAAGTKRPDSGGDRVP